MFLRFLTKIGKMYYKLGILIDYAKTVNQKRY